MEFWEFNLYCKGYKEVYYQDEVNMIKLAYTTGMFSRESKKKPKSLESYIHKIDKEFHKSKYRDVPVDVEKSKEIERKIQRLKEMRENGKEWRSYD